MQKLLSQKNFIRNALITIYILAILSISATSKAAMDINPIFTEHEQVQTQDYVGQIVMSAAQEFYLVVSAEEVYRLEANVDLFDLNGQQVVIEGFEIKHKRNVSSSHSLDPLPGRELNVRPVLVVFGISGVAN